MIKGNRYGAREKRMLEEKLHIKDDAEQMQDKILNLKTERRNKMGI